MRSSTVLASLFATLAIASPVHQNLHKRVYEWDIVTEIVTVTVTAGQETTITTQKTVVVVPESTKITTTKSKTRPPPSSTTPSTTTTTTTPPPPPPTTTSPPPPPPTTTQAPPPAPTTTQAPAPVVVEAQPSVAPVPAPIAETPSQSSSGDAVRDAALNSHNAYRAKHHVGALTWDDSLASSAAALAGGCTNKHGMIVGGQNIAAQGFSGQSGPSDAALMSQAVDSWYNEVDLFGGLYGQAQVTNSGVLHFTQVVWKATTKLGCAVHFCGTDGNIFPGFEAYTIVCNYLDAGNFAGQYAANVLAP